MRHRVSCAGPLIAGFALLLALGAAVRAYSRADSPAVFGLVLAGWLTAGAALGSDAERLAQAPPLRRAALPKAAAHIRARRRWAGWPPACRGPSAPPLPDASYEPAREHAVTLVGRLRQDATRAAAGRGARAQVDSSTRDSHIVSVSGGVMLTVLGGLASAHVPQWRAGRRAPRAGGRARTGAVPGCRACRTCRCRWLAAARRSSGRSRAPRWSRCSSDGSWREEHAASARHRIRQLIALSVGSWDATTAAIVTAILIGDRAGLDDRVERDLQEAGTYHVIAISGGNIAILAGCLLLAVPAAARALARRPRADHHPSARVCGARRRGQLCRCARRRWRWCIWGRC